MARLNANLTTLLQATYLGGSGYEGYWSPVIRAVMAFHPVSGDVYLAGVTSSADFPGAEGGAQASLITVNNSGQDSFLVRLAADLQSIIQSSYLGGSQTDAINDINIHPVSGDILAVGVTVSEDFPGTTGGYQGTLGGSQDGFVACLNEDLTELLQSTYVGSDDSSPGVSNLLTIIFNFLAVLCQKFVEYHK